MNSKIKEKLTEATGEYVRLVNVADVEMQPNKVQIHVHGKLESPDDDGCWYVRVKECGHGTSGVSFPLEAVDEVFRQPSGIMEITLK